MGSSMNKLLALCCIVIISPGLVAMNGAQTVQTDVRNKTAYLDWLKDKALEKKDLQGIIHLIPLYFKESSSAAYDLYSAALHLIQNKLFTYLHQRVLINYYNRRPMKGIVRQLIYSLFL